MESFWSTLKLELVYRRAFASHQQAHSEILDYSDAFYNRQRIHSILNYLFPTQFKLNSKQTVNKQTSAGLVNQGGSLYGRSWVGVESLPERTRTFLAQARRPHRSTPIFGQTLRLADAPDTSRPAG